MNPLKSVDALYDFIATVVLCAPDRFPVRDYLPPDQQMNLERAFEKLRGGIDVAYPEVYYEVKRRELGAILDGAYAAYQAGDKIEGARLVHEFQDNIFKTRK